MNRKAFPSGGAGMVGTAPGYLTFLEALRTGGGKMLQPKTAAAMTSHQIGDLQTMPMSGGKWGFGFGVGVLLEADPTSGMGAGTWQWGGIYGTSFWVDPAAKLSVVVLTNTTMAGAFGDFPDAMRRAVYAK